MAPTDPTTTSRFRITYTGPFNTHTMLFHGRVGVAQASVRSAVAAIVTQMLGAQWNGTTWNQAEYAAAGSNLFFPDASWTTLTASNANNPTSTSSPSGFQQYGGRGLTTGIRAKWYLFEVVSATTQDMRFARAESTTFGNIIGAFESVSASIGNVAGGLLSMYQYCNVGQNDYLTKKARS